MFKSVTTYKLVEFSCIVHSYFLKADNGITVSSELNSEFNTETHFLRIVRNLTFKYIIKFIFIPKKSIHFNKIRVIKFRMYFYFTVNLPLKILFNNHWFTYYF